MSDLLGPVDWNAWRRIADGAQSVVAKPAVRQVALAHAVVVDGKPRAIGEAERVALLVLGLGRQREVPGKQARKDIEKEIRIALRDIESAVLSCEQEIDYL